MEVINKTAPATHSEQAEAKDVRQLFHKDTISSLPRQQKKVLLHLINTKNPQSVADITRTLGLSDPRGHISSLRRRGYPIGDEWLKTSEHNRFKRYFIRKEVQDGRK